MSNDYGGESPSKTLVRTHTFALMERLVTPAIWKAAQLVLLGDAGDVRQLLSRNSGPITAIDCRFAPVKAARKSKLIQGVNLIRGWAETHAFDTKFGTISLDWCYCLSDEILAKSFLIIQRNLMAGGAFYLGFTKAHDHIRTNKGEDSSIARIAYVLDYMRRHNFKYRLEASYSYQSRRVDSIGVPMLYLVFTDKRGPHRDEAKKAKHFSAEATDIVALAKTELRKTRPSVVADRYMLPRATVGAWQAWNTMRDTRDHSGASNPNARLTIEDVITIRYLVGSGVSQRSLAKEYTCSTGMINHIVSGKRWGHVREGLAGT